MVLEHERLRRPVVWDRRDLEGSRVDGLARRPIGSLARAPSLDSSDDHAQTIPAGAASGVDEVAAELGRTARRFARSIRLRLSAATTPSVAMVVAGDRFMHSQASRPRGYSTSVTPSLTACRLATSVGLTMSSRLLRTQWPASLMLMPRSAVMLAIAVARSWTVSPASAPWTA